MAPQVPSPDPAPSRGRLGALPLALAAGAGVATGSLLARGPGKLASTLPSPTPFPVDLGVDWSPAPVFPDAAFRAAVDGLGLTVAALGTATTLVALAAAATLLAAVGSLRRRELAVRSALGRGPLKLAGLLVRRDARMLMGGVVAGLVVGAASTAFLHGSWPVERSGGPFVPVGPTLLGIGVAGALCLGSALALTVLPVRHAVRRLPLFLAAGARATADRWEGGLRRVATVLQTAVSLALLSASLLLWRALPHDLPEEGEGAPDGIVLLSASVAGGGASMERRAARYADFLDRVGALSTVASESIASPGAWTGVGTTDFVLADCGNCTRGMFWIPFLGEDAQHHAVSPGFFASAGMELLDGRDFTLDDGPGAEPVAVVSEPMARKNFEDGDPVGRRIRVGEGLESWYTVVGVVRERRPPGLGLPDEPAHGVYLSALQHAPDRVEVGFRGRGGGAGGTGEAGPVGGSSVEGAVRAAAAEAGLVLGPGVRTVARVRRRQAEPLRWAAGVAAAFGLVALVSALLGVHRVAAVEVGARRRELGVRLALGSSPRRLTRLVLGRTARSTLLGALLAVPSSVAVTARLREVLGDVPLFDLRAFAVLAALLVGAALAGAWGPAREAARLEPAQVMAEE